MPRPRRRMFSRGARIGIVLLLSGILSALSVSPAAALTTISDCSPANGAAIITTIEAGGDIAFDCGTATITTLAQILIGNNTSIDGNGVTFSGAGLHSIFLVHSSATLSVSDATLANGFSNLGGAIHNNGGTVHLIDTTLRDNQAVSVGGAASENEGGSGSGGLDPTGGAGSGTGGDAAAAGGAIFNAGGTITITRCTFSGNLVSATGGDALDNRGGSATSSVDNAVVTGGSGTSIGGDAKASGGAIFSDGGTVTIVNSTFSANSVIAAGGDATAFGGDATATGTNGIARGGVGTATGGEAIAQGGALLVAGSTVVIQSSTFFGNAASAFGGVGTGIGGDAHTPGTGGQGFGAFGVGTGGSATARGAAIHLVETGNLHSLVLANHSAILDGGDGIGIGGSGDMGPVATPALETTAVARGIPIEQTCYFQTSVTVAFSIADDGSCVTDGENGNQVVADVLLGPLADNGGPTLTHRPLSDSPAVDAGDCAAELLTDQRGLARVHDLPTIPNASDGCDAGAVEAQGIVDRFVLRTNQLVPLPGVAQRPAGDPIYVKFSLGGDLGLGIFESGFPRVQQISCATGEPIGSSQPAQLVGGLRYFGGADYYQLVWRTQSNWANTCRQLIVRFNDGSEVAFNVRFTPNR